MYLNCGGRNVAAYVVQCFFGARAQLVNHGRPGGLIASSCFLKCQSG